MKYMLLFYADEAAWMVLSEEERNAAIEQIGRWYGTQVESGRLVEGRRLAGKSSARTVDLGPAGRSRTPIVMDGPFVETKEALGSYAIVEVAELDEAVREAESWPGGGLVEIRPVVEG
jgi:hypothetical protein